VIIGKLIPAGTGYLVRQERIAEKKAAEALLEQDVEEVNLSSLLIDDNTDEAVLEKIAAQAAAEAAKAIIQEAEATD
jgi:hypothetical protein